MSQNEQVAPAQGEVVAPVASAMHAADVVQRAAQASFTRFAQDRIEQLRHQPAAQSMIQQLITSTMAKDQKFYLVKMPEDAFPSVEEFDTVEPLIERIVELVGQETALFPFMGYWLGITKGPLRYLVTPFGMLPLYKLPKPGEIEVDTSGWVGREAPVIVPAMATAATSDDQDEEEDRSFDSGPTMPVDDGTPVIMDMG